MNKKSYLVTLILMPIALIGLIFIQIYWVKSSIDNKEDAFLILFGKYWVQYQRLLN